jgi:hypothetical protein
MGSSLHQPKRATVHQTSQENDQQEGKQKVEEYDQFEGNKNKEIEDKNH